jgi:hypothetical protein
MMQTLLSITHHLHITSGWPWWMIIWLYGAVVGVPATMIYAVRKHPEAVARDAEDVNSREAERLYVIIFIAATWMLMLTGYVAWMLGRLCTWIIRAPRFPRRESPYFDVCPKCGCSYDIVSDEPGDRWAQCKGTQLHVFNPLKSQFSGTPVVTFPAPEDPYIVAAQREVNAIAPEDV